MRISGSARPVYVLGPCAVEAEQVEPQDAATVCEPVEGVAPLVEALPAVLRGLDL